MAEGKHPMTQIATRSLFENEDVRVWEMDVPPGETFGLHHHSNDYVLYITSGADLESTTRITARICSHARSGRSSI